MTERFHRRSIRLKGYDYTQEGAYYVTICAHARAHLFGEIANAAMEMTHMGEIVQRCWAAIPAHMPMVELDEFILMPNHVHGIIVITDRPVPVVNANGRGGKFPAPTDPPPPDPPHKMPVMHRGSLGHIIQTFKAAVSRQAVKDGMIERGTPIWQRGYYEHIIRDDAEHDRIAQYIAENPANWCNDRFFDDHRERFRH